MGSKKKPVSNKNSPSGSQERDGQHVEEVLQYARFGLWWVALGVACIGFVGIMCGQFGITFWEFFFATLVGKAIINAHIQQTVFIISVCNNQLLHWMENELIWVLSFVPGFRSILPDVIAKLHSMKDKYFATKPPVPSNIKVNKRDFSFASVWNTAV